jgi:hypothetical protein
MIGGRLQGRNICCAKLADIGLTRLVKKHRNGGQIAASGRQKLIAVHQGG